MLKGNGCKISGIETTNITTQITGESIHILAKIQLMDGDGIVLGEHQYVVFSKEVLEAAANLAQAVERDAGKLIFTDADEVKQMGEREDELPLNEPLHPIDVLKLTEKIPERFAHLDHEFTEWSVDDI